MKHRFLALSLAFCLLLALAACGGAKEDAPAPAEPSEEAVETSAPAGSEAPAETKAPVESEAPAETEAPVATEAPAESEAPAETAVPTPTAGPEPDQNNPIGNPSSNSAADVYAAVASAAGIGYDDMSAVVDAFYTALNTGDLDDFVYRAPAMSSQIEECFIAKVKPGRLDAVKAACAGRQQDILEDAAFYTATGEYTSDIKLTAAGDWLLFYVGPNASAATKAFNDCVK